MTLNLLEVETPARIGRMLIGELPFLGSTSNVVQEGKMFLIEKRLQFEAMHELPHCEGWRKNLHSHFWEAVLTVESESVLPNGSGQGMVVDCSDLIRASDYLVREYLDRKLLNETTGLSSPTCEALAEWLYNYLEPRIVRMRDGVSLVAVKVDGGCTSSCTYSPQVFRERMPVIVGSRIKTKIPLLGGPGDRKVKKR